MLNVYFKEKMGWLTVLYFELYTSEAIISA